MTERSPFQRYAAGGNDWQVQVWTNSLWSYEPFILQYAYLHANYIWTTGPSDMQFDLICHKCSQSFTNVTRYYIKAPNAPIKCDWVHTCVYISNYCSMQPIYILKQSRLAWKLPTAQSNFFHQWTVAPQMARLRWNTVYIINTIFFQIIL